MLAAHRALAEHLIVLFVIPGNNLIALGSRKHRAKGQELADSQEGIASFSEFGHKQRQGLGGVVTSAVSMADDDRTGLHISQDGLGNRCCALISFRICRDYVPLDRRQV